MCYLVIDTETNGLPDNGFYQFPIQISWILLDSYMQPVFGEDYYIYDKNVNYDTNALNFLGLSIDELRTNGKSLEHVESSLATVLVVSNAIIGHNLEFDLSTLSQYLPKIKELAYTRKHYCTMLQGVEVMEGLGFGNKWPKLSELHSALFPTTSNIFWHNSFQDCLATYEVFIELNRRGLVKLNIRFVDSAFYTPFDLDKLIHVCGDICKIRSCPKEFVEYRLNSTYRNSYCSRSFKGDAEFFFRNYFDSKAILLDSGQYNEFDGGNSGTMKWEYVLNVVKTEPLSKFLKGSKIIREYRIIAMHDVENWPFGVSRRKYCYNLRNVEGLQISNQICGIEYDGFYFNCSGMGYSEYLLLSIGLVHSGYLMGTVNLLLLDKNSDNTLSNSFKNEDYEEYNENNENMEILASSIYNYISGEIEEWFKYDLPGISFMKNRIVSLKMGDYGGVFVNHFWV